MSKVYLERTKEMKITDFVTKNNYCHFDHFRQGNFFYRVTAIQTGEVFIFPVPISDIGEATVESVEKSIMLMRYIRKAIEDNTIVPHLF